MCVYTGSYHCLVRVSISIHPAHTVVNHCENAQEHASHNNNECTGVQNPHRYMHAIAWLTVCIFNIITSIELHTLHLNRHAVI